MRSADAIVPTGWRARAWMLVSDLLVFDRRRLGWMLATRTTIGLFFPLILARLLDMPSLVWVGIGAFLLAIGDCVDDGDRRQPVRLAVGSLLGALALATGVLAGASLPLAVCGTLFWGVLAGLLGVYGSAYAAMAMPIAWAYLELGLPSTDRSLANALFLGSLFALGGVLIAALTLGLRIGGPHAPVRSKVSACYRALAGYMTFDRQQGVVSSETRVRAAIADARRVAAEIRAQAPGASRTGQRYLMLIEVADRLFSLSGALREAERRSPDLFCRATTAVAAALQSRGDEAALRALEQELSSNRAQAEPELVLSCVDVEQRMGRELRHALLLVLGDEAPSPVLVRPAPTARLRQHLALLIASLDRDSIVGRHALRFAAVCSVAVVIFWVFPGPFGYWVPLTVTVVLRPYAGMTLARTVQRVVGTTVGVLLGMVLMPVLPTPAAQLALAGVAFFAMMAVLPFNYSLAILSLSAGLIPFEHVLTPGLQDEVGLPRLAATMIGASLALVGGHLLWPTYERRTLPSLLHASIASMAAYADLVLSMTARTDQAAIADSRLRAGRDITNLQSALQRAMTEIGGEPRSMQAAMRASTAVQRLMSTLNALMNAAPALARSPARLERFRAAFIAALTRLGAAEPRTSSATLRAAVPTALDMGPDGAEFLAQVMERLISEYEMLRDAVDPQPDTISAYHESVLTTTEA